MLGIHAPDVARGYCAGVVVVLVEAPDLILRCVTAARDNRETGRNLHPGSFGLRSLRQVSTAGTGRSEKTGS